MAFTILQSFTNYMDAHILMGRLESEGVESWIKDENTNTIVPFWNNATGGIKVIVSEEYLEHAEKVLQKIQEEKKERYSCPKCGSHNIEYISTNRSVGNWLTGISTFLLTNLALMPKQLYHCFNCEAEFKEPVEKELE